MKKIKLESVFNEFTLMGIAVSGAFYLGEYWEGIAVILFYLIGEWFQHKAVHKARSDIKALLDVRPETATVIYNNTYKITVPEKVQPGETIEVKVGEKVSLIQPAGQQSIEIAPHSRYLDDRHAQLSSDFI